MTFENDIFISYAHIDNKPLLPDVEGWVTRFHEVLEHRLEQVSGRKSKFWRDPKLSGNDCFNDIIIEQLQTAAFLVSVLSPRYVKSDYCKKELSKFCQVAENSGGIRFDNKSRIFKVIKTPVSRENHPQELKDCLGYEFYESKETEGKFQEFDENFGPQFKVKFLQKIDDLAQDISKLIPILHTLTNGDGDEQIPDKSSEKFVYLAETTSDLKEEYENIKRELQQGGYTVIPTQRLPLNISDLEKFVRENLQKCHLSIHLFGRKYGVIPEDGKESIAILQNQLAASYSQSQDNSKFQRLIWMPIGLQSPEERQQIFIKQLQTNMELQEGAELLQTNLEDLKTHIKDKLKEKAISPPSDTLKRIYLIYGQEDRVTENLEQIDRYLFEEGFEVLHPAFDREQATTLRQLHQSNLEVCDAAIIYWGKTSNVWLQTQVTELRKASGYRQPDKSLKAKGIYVTAPQTKEKEKFRTHEAQIFRAEESLNWDILDPFLRSF